MKRIQEKVTRKLERQKSQKFNPLVPNEQKSVDKQRQALDHLRIPIPQSPPPRTPSRSVNKHKDPTRARSFGGSANLDALLGPVTPDLPDHLSKDNRVTPPQKRPHSFPKLRGLIE